MSKYSKIQKYHPQSSVPPKVMLPLEVARSMTAQDPYHYKETMDDLPLITIATPPFSQISVTFPLSKCLNHLLMPFSIEA